MSTGHRVRTRVRLSGQDTLSLYRECPSDLSAGPGAADPHIERPDPDAIVAQLVAQFVDLTHRVDRLAAEVRRLSGRRSEPRDAADLALLIALAGVVDDVDFTAADVAEQMRLDPDFRAVAAAADLDDVHAVAYWLRGMSDAIVGERVLVRLPGDRPRRYALR